MADVISEHRYFRAIAEACPSPLWALDLCGRVEFGNARAALLDGGAIAHLWRDRWPEHAQISVDRAIASATAGAIATFRACVSQPGEPRLYLETTVTPILDESGTPDRLLAVSRDVTATVETHGFLNSVIQLLPLALAVKDLHSGQCVLANAAAEDLFGVAPDHFTGAAEGDIRSQAMTRLEDGFDQCFDGSGQSRTTWEAPPARGQSNVRKLTTKRVTTFDDQGPRHMITLTEDVTEQVGRETALAHALDEAERGRQAQRIFLANISHEVRTPLNGLMAATEMLAGQPLPELAQELVQIIGSSAQALDRRLQDVLDIVHLDGGQVVLSASPFDAVGLVDKAVQAASTAAHLKGLSIRCRAEPEAALEVVGDASRLRQALDQLIDNAIKFTDHGEVAVAVEKMAHGGLRFSVADTGRGFDPEMKAGLFDRFYQEEGGLTRSQGGCGLGLSLAADLVELMGGRVDCALRPEGGSMFWMELPLPPAPSADEAAGTPGFVAQEHKIRILLADDHPANRRVVELVLGNIAQITAVADGRAAVDTFMGADFDLVLMDIQMPRLDGIAAVGQIRRWEAAAGRARTPIAMLTANAEDGHVLASRAAGADRHLAKPFTAAVLMNAVVELIQETKEKARRIAPAGQSMVA